MDALPTVTTEPIEHGRPILPVNVDSTMMNCFRSCHQKAFLEFVRGFRPTGISIDLHAGGCFATALEAIYNSLWLHHRSFPEAMLRGHAAFLGAWGDFEIPEFKRTAKTRDRVWEAVESYFVEYPPLTDIVQPYTAEGRPTLEYTFAIPLEPIAHINTGEFPIHPTTGGPFVYCGRFDMLGQKDGRPCVRDEKTTGSSIGQNWARQWQLRSQFMGYVWACRHFGLDVQEVVIRGISILKTDIKHAQSVQTYSDGLIARWYEQLRRDLWTLRRCWDAGYWDYNLGEACTSYGTCIFMDACSSNNSEPWLSDMEVRRWTPLSKNPAPVQDPANARALG